MPNLSVQVVDFSHLQPELQAPRLEFTLNVHNPKLFVTAKDRTRTSNGIPGLPFAERFMGEEPLEWCMIASTGQVLVWSATNVLAYGSIPGVPMEHQFFMWRNPVDVPLSARCEVHETWFDFVLDSKQKDRLQSPSKRRSGDGLAEHELCRVTESSMSPWLHGEPIEWMEITTMGGIYFYTASRAVYLWTHIGPDRLIILPRSPP